MNNKPCILISPLNWGLGHATRCIPIIHYYHQQGYRVILMGYGESLSLLKSEFPWLEHFELKGFNVRYSKNGMNSLMMLGQMPLFLWHTIREHFKLKKAIEIYKPQVVISDNRYGLFHKHVKSILITHQLNPILPQWLLFTQPIFNIFLYCWISRFNECWVPDFEGENSLAGQLSKRPQPLKNVKYIGPLSRFCDWNPDKMATDGCPNQISTNSKKFDPNISQNNMPTIVAMVSGPEPQRHLLAQKLIDHLSQLPINSLLLLGLPNNPSTNRYNQLLVVNHLPSTDLLPILQHCQLVVCRSGYSSIMDLFLLQKNSIIIPTPKQTEQEYLAKHLHKRHGFYSVKQSDSDLNHLFLEFINTEITEP